MASLFGMEGILISLALVRASAAMATRFLASGFWAALPASGFGATGTGGGTSALGWGPATVGAYCCGGGGPREAGGWGTEGPSLPEEEVQG